MLCVALLVATRLSFRDRQTIEGVLLNLGRTVQQRLRDLLRSDGIVTRGSRGSGEGGGLVELGGKGTVEGSLVLLLFAGEGVEDLLGSEK